MSGAPLVPNKATGKGKYPALAASADGTVCMAWKSGKEVHWQLYNAAHEPLGARQKASAATGDRPCVVALKNGAFLLFP